LCPFIIQHNLFLTLCSYTTVYSSSENRFEIRGDETVICVKDRSGLTLAKIDTTDLPKVQAFPGTWAAHPGPKGRLYVQGKLRDPQTDEHRTVYLHRWLVDADEDTLVQQAGDPLDCRREKLRVSQKHRSYRRQIERRQTETQRLQYTQALAKRLAARSGFSSAQMWRGLQRHTLAELGPTLEETANRLSGERVASLPSPRVRAGWQHRLPEILAALEDASAELVGRRQVESLFGVSRATAIQILDRFGANLAGNTLVLRRTELLARLRALADDPALSFERERDSSTLAQVGQDSLGELLGEAAQRLRNNRIYAQGEAAVHHRATRFGDFPPEIDLTPTTLHIQFEGLQDLLTKIGLIVYALQNDLESIEHFIGGPALKSRESTSLQT
jgi:hypothetical protein